MCTCINYRNKGFFFGRNMDLDYSFNENVVITPRKYAFTFSDGTENSDHYAMIGMAAGGDYPFYAEAANEKGLAMAGLNFPETAVYGEPEEGKKNIAPYEIIPWVLSQCESVAQVKELIKDLNLINKAYGESKVIPSLHWIAGDKEEGIIIESVKDGLKVYDDEFGVLTNNPDYSYHQWNMRNYINLSPVNGINHFSKQVDLKNYGQGMGAIGMPGDVSPASRFVRAVFNKHNSLAKADDMSNMVQVFRILDSVSMLRGATITEEVTFDITTYSCCINAGKGTYFYKTYDNPDITCVDMNLEDLDSEQLISYPLEEKMQISVVNV